MSLQARSREIPITSTSGYLMLAVGIGAIIAAAAVPILLRAGPIVVAAPIIFGLLAAYALGGIYMLQPNESALLLLFGEYRGTDRAMGLRWANPFYAKKKISLRARNLNTEKLKVNDQRGNPIEIAAALVWRVEDTARAAFDVEDFEEYVRVQSEAAIRHIASSFAYDAADGTDADTSGQITLRGSAAEVANALTQELSERFEVAGITVDESKLTHLAYAPEIAGAMLRRQQAEAVIAARQKIVLGAVSMVEMALKGLSESQLVDLDNERKAAMVSNLLVVLCGDKDASPVINTGTLYS